MTTPPIRIEESKNISFYCPKTGVQIGWAFTYVPSTIYCRECKREHTSTEQHNDRNIDDWLDCKKASK